MIQWEYTKHYRGHSKEIDIKWLQTMGNDGWELVAIAGDTDFGGVYIFKRQKTLS